VLLAALILFLLDEAAANYELLQISSLSVRNGD
jgi:hypothetical protein